VWVFVVGYIAVGIATGLLAGLLGVGGGLIIVPLLVACFGRQQFHDDVIMHLALGTSMATIVFTSVSSLTAHHRRGGVDWIVFRRIVLGIVAGTFAGTYVASSLPTAALKAMFAVFLLYVAARMLLARASSQERDAPGLLLFTGAGALIGFVSSLVGIGGGALSVPFMTRCGLTMRRAIGTSAAIGFPISVAGTIGFIINGLRDAHIPAFSLGYVNLPAFVCIASASVLLAPVGARVAHRLPVDTLRRIFALLLLVMAVRMLVSLIS
jgi:uncharacterized membrane protein YfcA